MIATPVTKTDSATLVTIHSYDDSGTCAFCRKEMKEGVTCSFDDGRFTGFLCRNDFWKFLRLEAPRNKVDAPERRSTPCPTREQARGRGLCLSKRSITARDRPEKPLPAARCACRAVMCAEEHRMSDVSKIEWTSPLL